MEAHSLIHRDLDSPHTILKFIVKIKLVYNGHPWDLKMWPLLTGGGCLEVPLCYKQRKWEPKRVVTIWVYKQVIFTLYDMSHTYLSSNKKQIFKFSETNRFLIFIFNEKYFFGNVCWLTLKIKIAIWFVIKAFFINQ